MPTSAQTSSGSSGPSQALLGMYQGEYQNALNLNNANYSNILSQYGQNINNTGQGAAGVASGYSNLENQVLGGIAGIGTSQSQAIADQLAQQSGANSQRMIQSGLGNSTVTGSMQRGISLDSQKAQIALANQIAQLTAGYQSQLGGAALQSQMQGVQMQNQTGNTLLGALASYKTPYPSWPPNSSQQSSQGVSGMGGAGPGGGISGGTVGNYPGNGSQAGYQGYGSPPVGSGGGPATYNMTQPNADSFMGPVGYDPETGVTYGPGGAEDPTSQYPSSDGSVIEGGD